jgi:flagellar protein FliO/FliZ
MWRDAVVHSQADGRAAADRRPGLGSLRLAKRFEGKFGTTTGPRTVKVVETQMLSPTLRLAVIEFHDREILVSTSKNGLVRLAEAPARKREDVA